MSLRKETWFSQQDKIESEHLFEANIIDRERFKLRRIPNHYHHKSFINCG